MSYFKGLVLVAFIALCGTLIYFKVEAMGDPGSTFNQTTRFTLGKYQIMRNLLGLHNDGDARAWYLEGTGPITLEVVQSSVAPLDDTILGKFVGDIKAYT